MKKMNQKLAYLEGLLEGFDLSKDNKEGRMIQELIELNKIMAANMEKLIIQIDEQNEYIEALDEDLALVEEFLFEEDEWEDEEETIFDLNDKEDISLIDEYDDDDSGYFEMECPNCEEIILVDQDLFDTESQVEVICPECDELILINDYPIITSHIMDVANNTGEIHYYSP